jgi:hypothetical protein
LIASSVTAIDPYKVASPKAQAGRIAFHFLPARFVG